jgi:hypothetical protein
VNRKISFRGKLALLLFAKLLARSLVKKGGLGGIFPALLLLSFGAPAGATEAKASPQIHLPLRTWVARPLPASGKGPCPTGCKHMRLAYNSDDGRIYFLGGDYAGPGYPASGRNELYSYSIAGGDWRLEYPYCGPAGEVQPGFPDEVGWVYDPSRKRFWMLPGFMYGKAHAVQCPAGKAEPVAGQVMTFDPATGKWAVAPRNPAAVDDGLRNMKFAQYDPKEDAILRFYWHGGEGMGVAVYDARTGLQKRYSLASDTRGKYLNNSRLNEEYSALDPEGRHLYVVSPLDGRLLRYDLDRRKMTLLADAPVPRTDQGRAMLVWDSVSKVLLWLHLANLDGYLTLYIYHPDTNTWEKDPMRQPQGLPVRGNSAVFDPAQNALLVMGGLRHGDFDPALTHFFLYRYGGGEGSRPGPASSANPAPNPALAGLSDNTWRYLDPVPSLRYMPAFKNPAATEALTPADRKLTREPRFREYSSPVYGDGKIFYFGGGHGGYPGNDMEIYDIAANAWTQSYKPQVAAADDPVYGSGGSENVYVDPATGEWRPYTIHGYGRTSYHAGLRRYVCTATFCRRTERQGDVWRCAEKDYGLIAFDPATGKWDWLAGRKADGSRRWPGGANLSQWDTGLGALLAFDSGGVWLVKDGAAPVLKKVNVDLGAAGIGGSASVYIPHLGAHLIARMPQGGKPQPALFLYDPHSGVARELTLPQAVRERIGRDGNFYMAYDTRNRKVAVLQGVEGRARVWIYDVIADAANPSPDNWRLLPPSSPAPSVDPEGAVSRAPFHYDPVHNVFILVQRKPGQGQYVQTWAWRFRGP